MLYLALVLVAVTVYVGDQLTKAWVVANLQPDQPRSVIGSVLQLNLIRNSGAAFSIGTGATWLLTVIACSVVAFVIFTARRLGSRGWALALGLLLGGSLGNLTDRMFRAPGPGRGHVVDFVQLPNFAIFNVADSAIVSAAVLIALLAFRGVGIDGVRVSGDKSAHERPEPDAAEHDQSEHDQSEHDQSEPGSSEHGQSEHDQSEHDQSEHDQSEHDQSEPGSPEHGQPRHDQPENSPRTNHDV